MLRRNHLQVCEEHRGRTAGALTVYGVLVLIAGLAGGSLKDRAFVGEVVESIWGLRGLKIVPLTSADLLNAVGLMDEYELDCEDDLHGDRTESWRSSGKTTGASTEHLLVRRFEWAGGA